MRSKLLFYIISGSLVMASIGCTPAANNSAPATANKPANTSNVAPAADTAAIETEIKKLANEGVAATVKNDTAALEKMWADNYMFVGQDGAVASKAQRIESMKTGTTKIETLSYDEIGVRSNAEGTGAILLARATVKGTSMGKPVDSQVRVSQVWSKMKDGWRQVNSHVTSIAKGEDAKTAQAPSNANKP